MKLGKLLLAVVGSTMLLGILVASASARNLEVSSQTTTALWRRMDYAGGFGTFECEVKLSGSFHSRTSTKTVDSLLGYITEGTVLRCARGGATINQVSFPWHRRYRGFTGTLPGITGAQETVAGFEWRIREPFFGNICTVSGATSSISIAYAVSGGTLISAEISGENSCSGINGRLSGTETNVTNGAGARITVRLI